jgi:hypothetical protein
MAKRDILMESRRAAGVAAWISSIGQTLKGKFEDA